MNKKLSAAGVALSIVSSALGAAVEKNGEASVEKAEPVRELAEESSPLFEAGFDNDFFTAYVWRNAVVNDRPVWEPCVWADLTFFEPFWVGGYVWQNWDLTNRRAKDGAPREMNETDFNVHVGATLWETEDEDFSVGLEIGNDFFTYRHMEDCPDSYEFYAKLTFDNPFVGAYAQYSQAYNPVAACYFELGLKKELNIGEVFGSENAFLNALTFGADWNLSMGSGKYLTEYLYGVGGGAYDDEAEEFENGYLDNGVGGTTIRFNLAWAVCDHFTLGLVAAYTGVLSGDIRDGLKADGYGDTFRDLVWGGVQAKLSF